ncbi:hypothetical protein ASPZODRAFT_134543 [Penicilliopsis zonata CBS 506.65]|uniref:Uncharacterized protein n=1 Tax=Penicilliopsis zonata CBS 506.65 TaxID=1073090 RepID=A0A1L9SD22_9EURO|nr:hypothetical protein ASPZODRAFT_134543 [Penicilliopsis zonata CBS 506.65]OJJ45120.1 hypothetical protein ASPZODRAFT_134543 [Penicilliopsis zonata CBS 506.65]
MNSPFEDIVVPGHLLATTGHTWYPGWEPAQPPPDEQETPRLSRSSSFSQLPEQLPRPPQPLRRRARSSPLTRVLLTASPPPASRPSRPARSSPSPPSPIYETPIHSSMHSDASEEENDEMNEKNSNVIRAAHLSSMLNNSQAPARLPQRSLSKRLAARAQRMDVYALYEQAKKGGASLQRHWSVQFLLEYTGYALLLAFVYFVLIGVPLWNGAVYWLYWVIKTRFAVEGGWACILGLSTLYAFSPLLIAFEPAPSRYIADAERHSVENTALLIPCYKSEAILGPTLEAARRIFPADHIFVIANGNSATPLDNTEHVCRLYGVHHVWSPVGSKIIAQFVGCYAASRFANVLLIDDDCLLPPSFPVVSDRLVGRVQCVGYTIKSVGPNSSRGTWCQQAQDVEYKISGLQRAFAGKIGSAIFPHGAISLWNREFLKRTFHEHPGFSVSEDWFFGDSCRRLGGRITMCSAIFVETETPSAVFFSDGGSRGGFGEMTIFKQRFLRWNFFFVNGMWYNLKYILGSWSLGWWEIGTKIFVFQEVYETILYLLTPFILPISFFVRPGFCGMMFGITVGMYLLNVLIFNELHLRWKRERVSWGILLFYYTPYKLMLTLINVASCYWSLYRYARYFARRHPKVVEDVKAIEVVLRLEGINTSTTSLGQTLTVAQVKGGGNTYAPEAVYQFTRDRRRLRK